MNIIQRGNPSIMSKIRESARVVSEANGLSQPMFNNTQQSSPKVVRDNSPIPNNINEMFGGVDSNLRAGSTFVKKPVQLVNDGKEIDYKSSMMTRVLNNLDILHDTKEYFNALQDLMALYVSGDLNRDILSRISPEDMKEIKGIVREFKAIIDLY